MNLTHIPNSTISHLIDEYIHNKRNRIILKLFYVDGVTYEEIAGNEEVKKNNHGQALSVRSIGYIIEKCSATLAKYIDKSV